MDGSWRGLKKNQRRPTRPTFCPPPGALSRSSRDRILIVIESVGSGPRRVFVIRAGMGLLTKRVERVLDACGTVVAPCISKGDISRKMTPGLWHGTLLL